MLIRKQDKAQGKGSQRYLNLYGAAYDPANPQATTTAANYAGAALLSLSMVWGMYAANTIQDKALQLPAGIGGYLFGQAVMRRARINQAIQIGNAETSLIDLKPDQKTPPTSRATMIAVEDIIDRNEAPQNAAAKYFGVFACAGVNAAAVSGIFGENIPTINIAVLGYACGQLPDQFARDWQLAKIHKRKWVITDKPDDLIQAETKESKTLSQLVPVRN